MVQPGRDGMMAIWPSHPSRPRPRCASGWPPGQPSAGHSSPAITVRWHGEFAYVTGQLPDGTALPLMRLRYTDSASQLGLRDLPRQPRRLRQVRPAHRLPVRHPAGDPRLRLRPLPRRHHSLDSPATPDELTGATTSAVAANVCPLDGSAERRNGTPGTGSALRDCQVQSPGTPPRRYRLIASAGMPPWRGRAWSWCGRLGTAARHLAAACYGLTATPAGAGCPVTRVVAAPPVSGASSIVMPPLLAQ